jgi:hypothetical protein
VVDSLQPGFSVWDSELRGFGVRRQRRDATFVLKYTFAGRQRFYTIGRHGSFTADSARQEARRLIGLIASGTDPAADHGLPAQKANLTIEDLCRRYLLEGPYHKPDKKRSSWATDRSNIERHIVPLIGETAAESLSASDTFRFVSNVTNGASAKDERTGPRGRVIVRGGAGVAARALAVLGAVFSFAVSLGTIKLNPVKGVKGPKGRAAGKFLSLQDWNRP